MNKKEAQKTHSLKRLKERYDISGDVSLLNALVRAVQSGAAKIICTQTNRVSIFQVDELYFAYDKKRKSIVTFLTKEMIDNPKRPTKHEAREKPSNPEVEFWMKYFGCDSQN